MQTPLGLIARLPIRTGRLTLQPLGDEHLPALAALLADPVVMRYFPRPMTLPESSIWLQRNLERYRHDGSGLFAVVRQDADGARLIGDCGLVVRSFGGRTRVELGYHFARDVWGQGLATEAARACVALAFEASDVPAVVALIRPENRPSQGVARRAGLQPRGAVLHIGLVHDVWHITREAFAQLALQ
ncbi:MAG: GNAT family N-acetyltransferase [Luteitalea sp.]|nr:GNAT family N-acetyltransferase [Acidobacteriota bacterium]